MRVHRVPLLLTVAKGENSLPLAALSCLLHTGRLYVYILQRHWAGKRYHFTRLQRVLSSGVCCQVKRYLNADKSQPIGDQIKNSLSTNRLRGENWIQNKTKAKRAQSVIEYKKKLLCPLWNLFRSIQIIDNLKLIHPTTKPFVVG